MIDAPADLLHRVLAHGQEHLLTGWSTLTPEARLAFVAQLAGVDFREVENLYARRTEATKLPNPTSIQPIPVEDATETKPETIQVGEECLRRGEVAALVVAGGQGSRLGFDKPKGLFPVGPVTGASLFRLHAEKVLALSRKYGKPVPFLVMTAPRPPSRHGTTSRPRSSSACRATRLRSSSKAPCPRSTRRPASYCLPRLAS